MPMSAFLRTVREKKYKMLIWAGCVGLILVASAPFFLTIRTPLVSDDWHHVWISTHRTQPLLGYFITNYEGTRQGGSYRPLVSLYFAVVTSFGKSGEQWSMVAHLLTLVLHVGTMLMIVQLGKRLFDRWEIGMLAALCFAVFPNHVEAVSWAAAVADPLATFFAVLAISAYFTARQSGRWWMLVVSVMSFALALCAKESVIVLPLLLLGYEMIFFQKRNWSGLFLRIAPFFLLVGVYAAVRYMATHLLYGYYGTDLTLDPMVGLRSVLSYLISHAVGGVWRSQIMEVLFAAFDRRRDYMLLATIGVALLALVRVPRTLWWLVGATLVSAVPVLRFGVNLLPGRWNDEGERYAYLMSVFVALLLAWVMVSVGTRLRGVFRGALVALCVGGFLFGYIQLFQKTVLWDTVGHRAEDAVQAATLVMNQFPETEFIFFGLPDNTNGVPMWRNGFPQRIEMDGRRDVISVSPIRTVGDGGGRFGAERISPSQVHYRTVPVHADIVGPVTWTDADTEGRLTHPDFALYALSYRDFARSADVLFTPTLRERARQRPVVAVFWDGHGWQAVPIVEVWESLVYVR